jgi:hypothetical protein
MRSSQEIRNPILCLPAGQLLPRVLSEARAALKAVLIDLRREAAAKAQREWKRNKSMTAAYWKAVSIYAGHIARLCREPSPATLWQQRHDERAAPLQRERGGGASRRVGGRESVFRPPVTEYLS